MQNCKYDIHIDYSYCCYFYKEYGFIHEFLIQSQVFVSSDFISVFLAYINNI